VNLVIVDTGCANLASVSYAFERLGAAPIISDDAQRIKAADRVVLPGVGSAPFAMKNIHTKNLKPVLTSLTQPVIGICLGMQILFETLEEGGDHVEGLGLVKGHISKLNTAGLASPHMGWNRLKRRMQLWRKLNMAHLSQLLFGKVMFGDANFILNEAPKQAQKFSIIFWI